MSTNPLLRAFCTNCKKNGMECECTTFHPNMIVDDMEPVDILTVERHMIEKRLGVIILTKEDCKGLMKFFLADGYISHEFHSDTHRIIHRIEAFLR